MNSTKSVVNVFLGCCVSSCLMEMLMAQLPQSANLITFLQFFFITLQGFIFTTKYGTVKPAIPLKQYAVLISLFFITSVANNYVYTLHVPSTLHMIIRSASSPASMLVSWYVMKRRPKLYNATGSLLITVGVALAMYGGATVVEESRSVFMFWCLGVFILLATLITGAFTGLQQEILYSKYGKHPEEMLFYTHAIPMPMFLGIYPQLRDTVYSLSWVAWFLISINIIAQFHCSHSVHQLATKETSVTVTFILTVRKFISLLISSIVFKSNLTFLHIVGTLFVVLGTFIYFDFFAARRQKPVSFKDK